MVRFSGPVGGSRQLVIGAGKEPSAQTDSLLWKAVQLHGLSHMSFNMPEPRNGIQNCN